MFYKKFLCTLVSVALLLILPVTSYAYTTDDIDNCLFISENMAKEIQTNMYGENTEYYPFLYGTTGVAYDFAHAMPYYALDFSKSPDAAKASDMLVYVGYCVVPTFNSDGKLISYTEFKQLPSGEWEIIGTSEGGYNEEFYNFITSDNKVMEKILSYPHAYLTQDVTGFNILLINGDNEDYFSFYNYINGISYFSNNDNIEFIDGIEILENAKVKYENYLNTPPDYAGATDNVADIYDDELTEDDTSDSYPPVNEEDVDYQDVFDEPVEETTPISDEDITYDYDSLVGSSDSIPNPKTGTSMPYAAATAAVLSMVCIVSTKKRSRK